MVHVGHFKLLGRHSSELSVVQELFECLQMLPEHPNHAVVAWIFVAGPDLLPVVEEAVPLNLDDAVLLAVNEPNTRQRRLVRKLHLNRRRFVESLDHGSEWRDLLTRRVVALILTPEKAEVRSEKCFDGPKQDTADHFDDWWMLEFRQFLGFCHSSLSPFSQSGLACFIGPG